MSKQPSVQFTLTGFQAPRGASKPQPSENDSREYITQFTSDDAKEKEKETRMIRCKPNVLASKLSAPTAALATNVERPSAIGKLDDKFGEAILQREGEGVYGLVPKTGSGNVQRRTKSVSTTQQDELRIAELPEAPSSEAYDDMPVEDFGLAMLRGMGMTGEMVTGTVDFVPRPARMGLGAKPSDVMTGKRSYKQLVDEAGASKSVIREGQALLDVATLGPRAGKTMTVISGRHVGLKCVVNTIVSNERAQVRLLPSEEDVTLALADLSEPGMATWKSWKSQRRPAAHPGTTASRHSYAEAAVTVKGFTPKNWLRENIRVRICDKHIAGGKAYLKKGTIVTVSLTGTCDVKLDDGPMLEGLNPEHLETVVSKGSKVLKVILAGPNAGAFASLLQKHREGAVVQVIESKEVVALSLDNIADYVGAEID